MICVALYGDQWCDVHDELPQSINATLQSIARRFWEHCRIYAEDRSLWRPEPLSIPALVWFPLSRWMLVETGVHNPTCAVPMRYTQVGRYAFTDLHAKVSAAVFAIRDEYFYEPDDRTAIDQMDRLAVRLRRADSFLELFRALRSILIFTQGRKSLWIRSPWIDYLLPPY